MNQDLGPFVFDHDLSFYQNKDNIPNQELVGSIITYFTHGEGSRVFDARTIMNLSYKEVTDIDKDLSRTEDLLGHLDNLKLSDLERHVLLGTMLKWRGGYPVNFRDEDQQRVMQGIEKRFLAYPEDTPERKFARRNEKTVELLEKLGIGHTNAIRHGVPAAQIFAEMEEDEDLIAEKTFTSFEDLFNAAAKNGAFGEFPNKLAYAARLTEVNFGFNQWLKAEKGWDAVDPDFYATQLTQPVFVEYLSYRQDQDVLRKKLTQQRRESWHPKPVQSAPETVEGTSGSTLGPDEITNGTEDRNDLVFVTYCWEDEAHQEKVRRLTKALRDSGENATMDKKEMQDQTALALKPMMLRNIKRASKVIIVVSRGYKERAESEKGGVFFEYSAIIEEIHKFPKKYVLVAFEPFNDDLLPLGLAGRVVLTMDSEASYGKLLHKLQDVDEFEFGTVAPSKPLLRAKDVEPLFSSAGSSAAASAAAAPPVLTIAEERLTESALPTDEHWVIRCINVPAIQIYARLWVDERKNLGSRWAMIPSLEPGHKKELAWIRHCDVIELAWSDVAGTKFYHLRIHDRKAVTKEITKAEFEAMTVNVGSNNDFLNRALEEFLRTFNLDLSKLPFPIYEYFLRAHHMLLS